MALLRTWKRCAAEVRSTRQTLIRAELGTGHEENTAQMKNGVLTIDIPKRAEVSRARWKCASYKSNQQCLCQAFRHARRRNAFLC